jgi:cytochrome c6
MLQICRPSASATHVPDYSRKVARALMRRLLSVIALCLALVLGASPSFAADADHGAQVFSANCAACHMGGGNVVNAERTLKKDALEAYLANYSAGHEEAIQYQVTNGKNAMPAFGGKLSSADIADVASYVESMSQKGWS